LKDIHFNIYSQKTTNILKKIKQIIVVIITIAIITTIKTTITVLTMLIKIITPIVIQPTKTTTPTTPQNSNNINTNTTLSPDSSSTTNSSSIPSPSNTNKDPKSSKDLDLYITSLLKASTPYKEGDPVDLYLKSRNINKYSKDTSITYCPKENKIYMINKMTDAKGRTIGIQKISLTKDGKKNISTTNVKIQLIIF
jgi:hypothetical protein